MRSIREQVEQAIAFGRSLDWIVTHLHVEPVFVDGVLRRMDTLARTTEDEQAPWLSFPAGEPDVIAELLDAIVPTHPRADQDRIDAVRAYAEIGWSDPMIAAALASTPKAICNLRARNGIPSPKPQPRSNDETVIGIVRQYAAAGCTDREIGALIGYKAATVAAMRQRHNIPAGKTYRSAAA